MIRSGGSNYSYMEVEAGELTVRDVERLLSLYKDVVTKYTMQAWITKEVINFCLILCEYSRPRTETKKSTGTDIGLSPKISNRTFTLLFYPLFIDG
ncbi:hypothetical protein ACOSP7_019676 [Xanthoceras sorbifolium]